MRKTVRTSISISPDLKRRMDEIGEEVNWSAVVSRAFEAKLAEIISTREVKNIEEVITRLRVAKQSVNERYADGGRKDGHRWASLRADVNQLENLEAFLDGDAWESIVDPDFKSPFSISDHVHMMINGVKSDEFSREAADLFWRPILGSQNKALLMNRSYIESVMVGALDIWQGVKDRI